MDSFLDLIRKVIPKKKKKDEKYLPFLREKYLSFQELLRKNNLILTIMAQLNETLIGESPFTWVFLRENITTLNRNVKGMIDDLNKLTNNKYPTLYQKFEEISLSIESLIYQYEEIPVSDYTIPLNKITKEMVSLVGSKNANLGEIKNILKLPTPKGFAITAYAFRRFLEHNGLWEDIKRKVREIDINSLEELELISAYLQKCILAAELPKDLEKAIMEEVEKLSHHGTEFFSVRSSALLEDTNFRFAGQFTTFLNVPYSEVPKKYKEVVASLYSPRAIYYHKKLGLPEGKMVMSVSVMAMVNAIAGGVIYTKDPNAPEKDWIIISAVRGLGKCAVEGVVTPEIHILDKEALTIVKQKIPQTDTMLICTPDGKLREEIIPEELRGKPSLNQEQLVTLAKYALIIEKHYSGPQDIEWALSKEGEIFILQTRPLVLPDSSKSKPLSPEKIPGYKVLIQGGEIACKGIGVGKAFVLTKEEDLKNFPEGAVLIARKTSPMLVTIMEKASAIVTDVGGATGHMASLAREFQVPTIVDTEIATKIILHDMEITVDAFNGIVYEGKVLELEEFSKREKLIKKTELHKTLEKILKYINPLYLIDPHDENFKPEFCQTYHDLTRFCHEKAKDEMFKISEEPVEDLDRASKLIAGIPLNLLIIDLGEGIKSEKKNVFPDDIQSEPLLAFLKGLTSLKWPEPRDFDVKGFLDMIANTATIPEEELRRKGLESYAFISKNYMNISLRLGYHLSTIEAYAGDNLNDNYIRFFFNGGGASLDRRLRRVKLITEILKHLDFQVKVTADLIDAQVLKEKKNVIEKKLELLGKLTVYTKQLDMVMYNDAITNLYIEKFLKEHLKKDN